MVVNMSGMKSLRDATVPISLRTSSLLPVCDSSTMALNFSGIRTDSIFTYDVPKIDNSFELKLDLFGMELHILFSCPLHHISQQAIVLLLSSLSDDPVVCDDFYSLHVSKHFIFSLLQHLRRRADFKWHT